MAKVDIDTIIFDMDGVFCDFVGYMEQIHEMTIEELNTDRDIIGRTLESTVPMGLFKRLPPMPDYIDMMILYRSCRWRVKDTFFCSLTTTSHRKAREDKRAWLNERIGADVSAEFVSRGSDKALFAHPKALLIDDHAKNCDPFVKAGGHAIKHESAKQTIEELFNDYNLVRY